MMTKIKSSKIAAFKLSMGILVTAALLMIFAFDKDDSLLQDKKTTNKKAETTVNAQQKEKTADEQIFVQVEQMPEYPGGEAALRQFLASNVKYPDDAVKSGTQGKVFVKFVVNKDGKVVNPKIARSVSPSIDKEALRVVSIMPNWTPGKQRGKNVAVEYTVPILFKLK